MDAIRSALGLAGWVAFALAVLLDLHALYCGIRRNVKGSGPSGVPVLSLVVYVVICQWRQRLLDLVWLAAFHVACQLLIPLGHRWLLARLRARK